MRRLRGAGALLALALAGHCAAAAPSSSFAAAVDDTSLGLDPGRAFFMVDVLAAQGRADDAQSLRRALWQRQLARMRGKPFADEPRVAQALEQGRSLPEPDAGLDEAWREAYNASARLGYAAAQQVEPPAAFAHLPGLQPLGGGLWTQAGATPRYLLALTLEATRVPLPLQPLQLRFGSAEAGLVLQCRAGAASPMLAAGQSTELACDGQGDARWQQLLPTLLGAARTGGEAPLLLPASVASAAVQRQLWRGWDPSFDAQLAAWQQAAAQARAPTAAGARWLASPRRLAPPQPPSATAAAPRPAAAGAVRTWAALQPRLLVSVLALLLFAAGRLALGRASVAARNAAALGLGVLVAVPLLATVWGPGKLGGDGWSRLGVVVSGLALAGCVGMAVIVAMLLHRLHALLDAEGRSWPGVIASGWRRALWMFGTASRGEFWGFALFAAWAWALAVPLGRPWTPLIGLALLVPLWSLAWRRALSLTRAEIGLGLTLVAVLIVDLILRQHL